MKDHDHEMPPRLLDGDSPAAVLLRRGERHVQPVPQQDAAWDRLLARLARDAGRWRLQLGMAAACGAVAGAAVLYFLMSAGPSDRGAQRPPPVAGATNDNVAYPARPRAAVAAGDSASIRSVSVPTDPGHEAPHIRLRRTAVDLPAGTVELVGEAQVVLSPAARARAFTTDEAATVDLATGTVDLQVDKRPAVGGHRFEVGAFPYRFSVLGTRFRVVRTSHTVKLEVSEGRVAVFEGQRSLGVIGAGHHWEGVLEPPAPTDHASVARTTCGARAARDARDGLACYLGEARGDDLAAEVGLYEAARLQRDALSDPVAALATLQEHRRRFPSGELRIEIALSIAELLPRLGRYQEALEQTTTLLGDSPRGERLGELLLLRGHILREGFHDCAGAERAYAAATEAAASASVPARAADPATFWRAVCLEALGRRAEARTAYQLYLDRPAAAMSAQARARLGALEREHSDDARALKGRDETGGGSP